jgi:hypothetical protein
MTAVAVVIANTKSAGQPNCVTARRNGIFVVGAQHAAPRLPRLIHFHPALVILSEAKDLNRSVTANAKLDLGRTVKD